VSASLDETASGSGLAMLDRPMVRPGDLFRPGLGGQLLDAVLPPAYASACWQDAFTACASGSETRSFNACTIGPATLTGSVGLSFSESNCTMGTLGDTVTRDANFTLTGPYGGTLAVTSPGGGQKVTNLGSGSFSYAVLGMERVATTPKGTKLFDVSTNTSSPLTVTGTTRSSRVVNGGTLVVTHNILNYTATLSPSNLTWAAGCNCPISGSWNGTLSGSRTGSYVLAITGCGTGTVTANGKTEKVDFDRCGPI
jgi:hypothetical protein